MKSAMETAMFRDAKSVWDTWKCRVVDVEKSFDIPLVAQGYEAILDKPWRVHGTVDLVVEFEDHRGIVIVDHKTSSSDSYYANGGAVPFQVGCYFMAYPEAKEFLYFVLLKPQNKQREGESDDDFADRMTVKISERRFFRTPEMMRIFQRDLVDVCMTIERNRHDISWPPNPDGCRKYGSLCQYSDICSGYKSATDYPIRRVLAEELQTVRATSLSQYMSCPRKWYYPNELGIDILQSSNALAFGSRMHEVFADYWRSRI